MAKLDKDQSPQTLFPVDSPRFLAIDCISGFAPQPA